MEVVFSLLITSEVRGPRFAGSGGEGREPAGVSVFPASAWHSSAISGVLFLFCGLGGGTGGCLGVIGGCTVLGAGLGTEFGNRVTVGFCSTFFCSSFLSWPVAETEVDSGLLGGSRGCLGGSRTLSCAVSTCELGRDPTDSCLLLRFILLSFSCGSAVPWLMWPFLRGGDSGITGVSSSGISIKTPLFISSSLGFLIEIFLSRTSEVSRNVSLLFLFLHFHGLKNFPIPENLLFLLVGGVGGPGGIVGGSPSSALLSSITGARGGRSLLL